MHLTSEVYRRQVGNIAHTAVMVLFADKASDDGSGIWASKQRMADELGGSKQTIIATIQSLIAAGLVKAVGERKSPNGYTVEYAINVKALRALPLVKSHAVDQSEDLTGQAISPVKEANPTGQILLPDQSEDLTQTTLNHPKPYNSSKSVKAKASANLDQVSKPNGVNDQVWSDFIAHRKAKKAPVSKTALTGVQREADKAGWSLEAALTEIVVRNWQGFKAEWVAPKVGASGHPAHATFASHQPPQHLPEHEWRALMGDEEFERQKSSLQIEEASAQ